MPSAYLAQELSKQPVASRTPVFQSPTSGSDVETTDRWAGESEELDRGVLRHFVEVTVDRRYARP
jgi:hypothetical protein